jgi:hypothetical protein
MVKFIIVERFNDLVCSDLIKEDGAILRTQTILKTQTVVIGIEKKKAGSDEWSNQ